jgi:phage-related protein (TIGR01555 family)
MPETEVKRGRGRPPKAKIDPVVESTPHADEALFDSSYWSNMATGLGQRQDKTAWTHYGNATILDDSELTQLCLGDGLASRIVNSIPQDATREGIWIEDETTRKKMDREFERLGVEEALFTALSFQRQYRGSLIIIGAMDGRTVDQPLNEKAVRTVEFLKPIDATCVDLQDSDWDMDPMSPTFGKIIRYSVQYYIKDTYVRYKIHYTRVLEFKNDPAPTCNYAGLLQTNKYWGLSSLQAIYTSLSALGSITQSTVNIILDFVSGTYKFKNLASLLAAGGETSLAKRLQAIQLSTSVLNARVIDSEETFSKEYATVTGIDALIDRYMLMLSGSTGIPVTRLFGRAPSGLNATGEADYNNYLDIVQSFQKNRLKPQVRRLLTILCYANKLNPDVDFEFNALYQMSEIEKANLAKTEADTQAVLVDTNLRLCEAGVRDYEAYSKELGYGGEYTEIEPDTSPTEPPAATEGKMLTEDDLKAK